jgi:hypothetical protein
MTPPDLLRSALAAGALALLGGCASLNQCSADVASFGTWPAGRSGGSYAFERLPSQQAQADDSRLLEDAARPALAMAGFQPVAEGAEPDLLVQVGARISRSDRSPWDDPLWWPGAYGLGYGPGRHGAWRGAYWGGAYGGPYWSGPGWGGALAYSTPRYEREVALLIRDRASGKPLFESRASSEGTTRSDAGVLTAMFEAALTDFPRVGLNPRRVDVVMP